MELSVLAQGCLFTCHLLLLSGLNGPLPVTFLLEVENLISLFILGCFFCVGFVKIELVSCETFNSFALFSILDTFSLYSCLRLQQDYPSSLLVFAPLNVLIAILFVSFHYFTTSKNGEFVFGLSVIFVACTVWFCFENSCQEVLENPFFWSYLIFSTGSFAWGYRSHQSSFIQCSSAFFLQKFFGVYPVLIIGLLFGEIRHWQVSQMSTWSYALIFGASVASAAASFSFWISVVSIPLLWNLVCFVTLAQLGVIFLSELLSVRVVVGCVLLFLSLVYVSKKKQQQNVGNGKQVIQLEEV